MRVIDLVYVRSSRTRVCLDCGSDIEPGGRAVAVASAFGTRRSKKGIHRDYHHLECWDLWEIWMEEDNLGWDPPSLKDGGSQPLKDDNRITQAWLDRVRGHFPHAVCRLELWRLRK